MKVKEHLPGIGTWIEVGERVFFLANGRSQWVLKQYSPDGWKSLITPAYPNGMHFKTIETFNTKSAAMDYLKKYEEK